MTINFSDMKLKQLPNVNLGMTVTLTEADSTISAPTELKEASIDTSSFTNEEKQLMDDFIALLKSKIQP